MERVIQDAHVKVCLSLDIIEGADWAVHGTKYFHYLLQILKNSIINSFIDTGNLNTAYI